MPKRPITAIRKSKPLQQLGAAEGQAQLPGHGVDADRREREARASSTPIVLKGGPCPCR